MRTVTEVTAMTGSAEPFYTVVDLAKLLKVCTKTVLRWVKRGDLLAHRFNGRIRVSEADLQAFLRRHRGGER